MISDWFNTTFTIYRQVWTTDGNDNQTSTEQSVGTFSGHIQQASRDMVLDFGLKFETAYSLWCAVNEDVQKGDILRSGENVYSVKAIQVNNIGDNAHLELLVEGGPAVGS